MSKKIYLLSMCFFTHLAAVPTMQELFLRANVLYQQGHSQEALSVYQSIEPKGSAVLYNMGLCWYRLGDYGHALASWRQAERIASVREYQHIERAIAIVHERLHIASSESVFSRCMWKFYRYASVVPPLAAQLLFLVCVCMLFFYKKWWYYGVHRKSLIMGMSCIAVLCAWCLCLQYAGQNARRGVVIAQVPVYSGPDTQFHERGNLSVATEVVIQDGTSSWYKVANEKINGWVKADAIVVV
jgi:tetratricopeptide (TPR) repeat protein